MFSKSKSAQKEACHVCGVTNSKLKKQQTKLDKKPKRGMVNAGGIMLGVSLGVGALYLCPTCGATTCTDCRKVIERENYRKDYVCPQCNTELGREALVEK